MEAPTARMTQLGHPKCPVNGVLTAEVHIGPVWNDSPPAPT
jgi:hypothetical protein